MDSVLYKIFIIFYHTIMYENKIIINNISAMLDNYVCNR